MKNVPKHIGIILDGNRRFAKRLMLKPWKGHEWGAQKVHKALEWTRELGVKEVTFYALSLQNFNRPKQEFDYLMNLFRKEFDTLMQPDKLKDINKNGLKINFIGRLHLLPADVQGKMRKLIDATKNNKKGIANFAMAYGGREEVIDAVQKLVQDGKKVTEKSISARLWLNSEPDLIIRTGGERRISNFLLWQGHYAELMFLDKAWPDIEKQDIVAAIQHYAERERRFGK